MDRKKLLKYYSVRILNYFHINDEKYPEPHRKLQATIVLGFMCFYALAWISYFPIYYFLDNYVAIAAVAFLGFPSAGLALLILRFGGSFQMSALVGNLGGVTVLTGIVLGTGGSYSPVYAWFFFAAITTFLLNGRKVGRMLALLTIVITSIVISLEILGYKLPIQFSFGIDSDYFKIFNLAVYTTALFFLAVVTDIYDALQKNAFSQANDAREKMHVQLTMVSNLLNNMKQAVFTINEGGLIVPPVSKHSQDIFEIDIEKRNVWETVFKDIDSRSEEYSKIKSILTLAMGEDLLQWEVLEDQLPGQIVYETASSQTKYLRCSYNPILDGDEKVTEIMMVVEDVTALVRAEETLASERKAHLQVFGIIEALLNTGIERSYDFINNSKSLLNKIDSSMYENDRLSEECFVLILRNLHTLKGNARQHGFSSLSTLIHEEEQQIIAVKGSFEGCAEDSSKYWKLWFDIRLSIDRVVTLLWQHNEILARYFKMPHILRTSLLQSLEKRIEILADESSKYGFDRRKALVLDLIESIEIFKDEELRKLVFKSGINDEKNLAKDNFLSKEKLSLVSLRIECLIKEEWASTSDILEEKDYVPVYEGNIAKLKSFLSTWHPQGADGKDVRSVFDRLQQLVDRLDERQLKKRIYDFKSMVEELSERMGKKIDFFVTGDDATMQKELMEQLCDGLVHLIRNAIDHAIETPQERMDLGKPGTGRIEVKCQEQFGRVMISVLDDGAGINYEKLYSKAVKSGMIQENSNMTKEEKLRLIFTPSLSTRDVVSEISGRGYGMEAVSACIHDLGGDVEITSELNQGSEVKLWIPFHQEESKAS